MQYIPPEFTASDVAGSGGTAGSAAPATTATIPFVVDAGIASEITRLNSEIGAQRTIKEKAENEAAKTFLETKIEIPPFDGPANIAKEEKTVQVILQEAIAFLNSEEGNINSTPDNYQNHCTVWIKIFFILQFFKFLNE